MKFKEKQEAIRLRYSGLSLREIAEKLNVGKSTVSLWVRDLELSPEAKLLIQEKYTKGQIASQEAHREKKRKRLEEARLKAIDLMETISLDPKLNKIICALMYWCEGVKNDSYISFINSDPNLVATFLRLLRQSYVLDENKFRICIHIHSYHDVDSQLTFWSEVTGVPLSQFIKPYRKNNGGVRIRKNYQGCANIRYHDARLAQDLLALAREFIKGPIG